MDEYISSTLTRHIRSLPDFEWDWSGELSLHPRLTTSVLREFRDKPWNFFLLSSHKNFTFDWIDLFPGNSDWNWNALSERATMTDVLRFKDRPWNWNKLTLSENIKDDDMLKHPYFAWDFNMLGYSLIGMSELRILRFFRNNFHIQNWLDFTAHTPWEVIKSNLDIPWVPRAIKFEPGDIRSDDDINILEYFMERGYYLDWDHISHCATLDVVKRHMNLPWEWRWVSAIPSLAYTDVLDNPDLPWDMNIVPIEDMSTIARRWCAAQTIQRIWRRCVSDPSHPVCMRRLRYEFNTLLL